MNDPEIVIVLSELNKTKLEKVLILCKEEKINFRFEHDIFDKKHCHILKLLENMIKNYEEIPLVFKDVIENEYEFILDCMDDEEKNEINKKLKDIKYKRD